MAVTMDGAMVGYTYNVTPTKSTVRTIIDSEASIAALIQSSRDQGTVRGTLGVDGTPLCRMYYLPEDNLPRPGDVVVTSGVGDLNDGRSFPKGIPIGTVRESTRADGEQQAVRRGGAAGGLSAHRIRDRAALSAGRAGGGGARLDRRGHQLHAAGFARARAYGADRQRLLPARAHAHAQPTPGPTVTVGEDGQEVLVTPAPTESTPNPARATSTRCPTRRPRT